MPASPRARTHGAAMHAHAPLLCLSPGPPAPIFSRVVGVALDHHRTASHPGPRIVSGTAPAGAQPRVQIMDGRADALVHAPGPAAGDGGSELSDDTARASTYTDTCLLRCCLRIYRAMPASIGGDGRPPGTACNACLICWVSCLCSLQALVYPASLFS